MSVLVKYDAACRALADAVMVDEAKDIRDKSEAMRVYARQANNKSLEVQAAELRFRAERRIGELMAAQREAGLMSAGGRPKTGFSENPVIEPTLSDAGIDKNLANRARRLAAVPKDEFEGHLATWRERVTEETEKVSLKLLGAGEKAFVQHNSGTNEWYTPGRIVEAARAVLGAIEFDPASSEEANKTVEANLFYTAEEDALSREWPIAKIWMNPPYARGLVSEFAVKLVEACRGGSEAIVLVNNATETDWFQHLAKNCDAVCFHKGRVRYATPEGDNSGAPLQGQAIFYFGSEAQEFRKTFSSFGVCF